MQVQRDTAQGFRMKGYTVESLDTVAENTEEFLTLLLEYTLESLLLLVK